MPGSVSSVFIAWSDNKPHNEIEGQDDIVLSGAGGVRVRECRWSSF